MVKIYEAVRQHEQSGGGQAGSGQQVQGVSAAPPRRRRIETRNWSRPAPDEMEAFQTAMEAALKSVPDGKIVLFASARIGEGKSTVVERFAQTLTRRTNQSVLIIDAGTDHTVAKHHGGTAPPIEELFTGGDVTAPISAPAGSLTVAYADARATTPFLNTGLSVRLRGMFDYTLIDAPAISAVSSVVSLAPFTDGAVLVVEAERTRWPIVLHARDDLERSGGKVLGVFLSKRRFYIPPSVYRWF